MIKKVIRAADGLPFSKAVVFGKNIVEISGQIGLNDNGKLVDGIEAQTRKAFENVEVILKEIGLDLDDLIKIRVFLVNMNDYGIVNKIYSEYFNKYFPTRVALTVKELPLKALIELDCTACEN